MNTHRLEVVCCEKQLPVRSNQQPTPVVSTHLITTVSKSQGHVVRLVPALRPSSPPHCGQPPILQSVWQTQSWVSSGCNFVLPSSKCGCQVDCHSLCGRLSTVQFLTIRNSISERFACTLRKPEEVESGSDGSGRKTSA